MGKGNIVSEIDEIDGMMGRVDDREGIKFRLINRRKGKEVRGNSKKDDRKIYSMEMKKMIKEKEKIKVVEGGDDDIVWDGERI